MKAILKFIAAVALIYSMVLLGLIVTAEIIDAQREETSKRELQEHFAIANESLAKCVNEKASSAAIKALVDLDVPLFEAKPRPSNLQNVGFCGFDYPEDCWIDIDSQLMWIRGHSSMSKDSVQNDILTQLAKSCGGPSYADSGYAFRAWNDDNLRSALAREPRYLEMREANREKIREVLKEVERQGNLLTQLNRKKSEERSKWMFENK